MTNLIGLEVYSFSLDEAYNSKGGYVIEEVDVKTKHSLYISSIYVNADAIKMAYDLKKDFVRINKDGTKGKPMEISRILFSDGSCVYTSSDELVKIREFTRSGSM